MVRLSTLVGLIKRDARLSLTLPHLCSNVAVTLLIGTLTTRPFSSSSLGISALKDPLSHLKVPSIAICKTRNISF